LTFHINFDTTINMKNTYSIGRHYSSEEGPGFGYSKNHFAVREVEGGRVVARFNTSFEAMYYLMWLDSQDRKTK